MKRFRTVLGFVFASALYILSTGSSGAANLPADLQYMTEQVPPYNYVEKGELKGISVDLLRQIAGRLGIALKSGDITVAPWETGYRRTLARKNTILFSTARTPDREKKFHWIGPISPIRVVLFTLKGNPPVADGSLERMKIGVIRDDIGHQQALKAGAAKENLVLSRKPGDLVRLLEEGKIDAVAHEETGGMWFVKHEANDPGGIRVAHVLYEGELYYAANRRTSKDVVAAFQKGLDELKKEKSADGSSAYEKIFERYLKPSYIRDGIANDDVMRLVDQTAADLASDAQSALKRISAGEHPYRNRDNPSLYVFVYDSDINMVAHADNATMVGKNFRGKTDVEGKPFRDYIMAGAMSVGSGWEDYVYTSPSRSGLYYKTTYYKRVKGSDGNIYIVCSGKFKDQP